METRIEAGTGRDPEVASEAWTSRWYTPLAVFGATLFTLLVVLLAVAEVLLSETVSASSHAAWTAPIAQMEDAMRRGDVATARRLWLMARAAALRSRDWEAMVAVGDASLRLGAAGGPHGEAQARAREAYLAALLRARQEQSLEGVLRAGEAFDALGDDEMVEQAIRIAERVAGASDPHSIERVRRLAERWSTRELEAERLALPR